MILCGLPTAAAVILQARIDERVDEPLTHWLKQSPASPTSPTLCRAISHNQEQTIGSASRALMIGGNARTFILRGARRVVADVAARIVVFDDITEVLQAQRDTAGPRWPGDWHMRSKTVDPDPAVRRAV